MYQFFFLFKFGIFAISAFFSQLQYLLPKLNFFLLKFPSQFSFNLLSFQSFFLTCASAIISIYLSTTMLFRYYSQKLINQLSVNHRYFNANSSTLSLLSSICSGLKSHKSIIIKRKSGTVSSTTSIIAIAFFMLLLNLQGLDKEKPTSFVKCKL